METLKTPSQKFQSWVANNVVEGTDGAGNPAYFVPYPALQQYWTEPDQINRVLERASDSKRVAWLYNKDILKDYLRIFSILVYISRNDASAMGYLVDFKSQSRRDHSLPLAAEDCPIESGRIRSSPSGKKAREDFLQHQYLFDHVIFPIYYACLHPKTILPFKFVENLSNAGSGVSVVKKCSLDLRACDIKISTVPPSARCHSPQTLTEKLQVYVVVKEYSGHELEYGFTNEVQAYSALLNYRQAENASDYFLGYYGSFRQAGKGYLVLEFADQGSLQDFFAKNSTPYDQKQLRDFWEALSILFLGLSLLHGTDSDKPKAMRIIHQDLKPANIFVFRVGSVLDYKYHFKIGHLDLSSARVVGQSTKDLPDWDNRVEMETTLQELDQSLRQCWTELGLPIQNSVLDSIVPQEPPQESITRHTAPTRLKLDDAKKENHKARTDLGYQLGDSGASSDESSVASPPQGTIFDTDSRSRATYLSTVANSPTRPRKESASTLNNSKVLQSGVETVAISTDPPNPEAEAKQQTDPDDCDAETSYSIDSLSDEPSLSYIETFINQLSRDIKATSDTSSPPNIASEYYDPLLKAFAWMLHGESLSPFQWEAAVILHRRRKQIIDLLSHKSQNDGRFETLKDVSEASSQRGEDDESPERHPFKKPEDMLLRWVIDIEQPNVDDASHRVSQQNFVAPPADVLFQLPNYEAFIRESDAYQWLVSKIRQYARLEFGDSNSMLGIEAKVQSRLRAQKPLHSMSRRGPSPLVTMTFNLEWDLIHFIRDHAFTCHSPDILDNILCLTGSYEEAQVATAREYMDQTWCGRAEPLLRVIEGLINLTHDQEFSYQLPERKSSRANEASAKARFARPKTPILTARMQTPSLCSISVTANQYVVVEIAEQVGWLASAMRPSPKQQGVVSCYPNVRDLDVRVEREGTPSAVVIGSCCLAFDLTEEAGISDAARGFCWGPLFRNPILVRGYPIAQRPRPNTGLEVSLGNIARLIRSQQVVQWGERILMKGFSSMLIATLATADVVVWHLLRSHDAEERISYIDPRLDTIDIGTQGLSLRMLEGSRHIIGWCASATDYCGHATARYDVSTSGLRKPPSSIVIDRLYLEAGTDVVGGLSMGINKKEQSTWLERESDYPSLLKWVSLQPVIFYDISDRRAWLIDGASALLHLVRTSLFLDENDSDSPYDWVFDYDELKDVWAGYSGRHAALKTLKNWDNLSLNLYVIAKEVRDGIVITQYSTLGTRISKLLHSIEILIDRQAKVASRDGIKIPQTIDLRRNIVGFDILDVVTPLGPIDPRIMHLGSRGDSWIDMISSTGITTIFGQKFGDLIRPDDPGTVCNRWKSAPTGMDYMAVSISTMKLLYEKRLQRTEPGLSVGEMTSKIVWSSPCQPFTLCACVGGKIAGGESHLDPVQFLVSRNSLMSKVMLKGANPVDLSKLDEKGAVVFGHMPLLGRRKDGKAVRRGGKDEIEQASSTGESSRGILSTSSVETGSTAPTGITVPSSGTEDQGDHSQDDAGKATLKKSTKPNLLKRLAKRLG